MRRTILLCLLSFNLLAQSKDPRGEQIIVAVGNKSISNFALYPPNTTAKGTFENIAQASNNTPEKLMQALLSETSFEWTKHNSIGGEIKPKKSEYYAKMKSMDKAKNYYALRCKWTFEAAGSVYAIVKFDFVQQDGQRATGAYTLVKKNNRWYKHEKAYTTNTCLLFIAFKDQALQALFEAKPTDNPIHNALLTAISTPNGIDLDKLFGIYDAWKKGKDDAQINYFLDPTSWINQK